MQQFGSNFAPTEGPADDPTDAAPTRLLEAAARGDDAAWRKLVGMYASRVFAMAQSRCHDPDASEEVTQSVFATIAIKIRSGEYAEQGRFESWLFRVAMNRVRDVARAKKRRARLLGPTLDAEEAGVPAPASAPLTSAEPEQVQRLRWALDQLSDADREVIELRHHGEQSFRQMAQTLGEPVGTLLARHHRALRKLREILESAMGPPLGALGKEKEVP
jgi:RNA polymerase sigma-70 factor (ECF subfamily)